MFPPETVGQEIRDGLVIQVLPQSLESQLPLNARAIGTRVDDCRGATSDVTSLADAKTANDFAHDAEWFSPCSGNACEWSL